VRFSVRQHLDADSAGSRWSERRDLLRNEQGAADAGAPYHRPFGCSGLHGGDIWREQDPRERLKELARKAKRATDINPPRSVSTHT
jgi:hypothetical protein